MPFEFQQALQQREQQGLYRSRRELQSPQGLYLRYDGKDYLNFGSNDYLSLANHPAVIASCERALRHAGLGAGASHLLCGHHRLHHELEQALAQWSGRQAALLFSTGYMANLGVISTLAGPKHTIYADRLVHASLLDGALLSRARLIRFAHNAIDDLTHRMQENPARPHPPALCITEGVFSMDGDSARLPELAATTAAHGALLVVDDAHGFGVLGANGGGTLEYYGLNEQQVPVLIGTFGKALGTSGAFVAGATSLIEYLIQFARPYIYTTAMPPALAAATLTALELVQRESWRRQHLQEILGYFREKAATLELPLMPSQSAIAPIQLGSAERALRWGDRLRQEGLYAAVVRPPTVPKNQARLRISFTAAHQTAHVDRLLEVLAVLQRESPA